MRRVATAFVITAALSVMASACLPLARAPATSTPESPTPTLSLPPSAAPSSSLIPAGPSPSPSPTAASVNDIHVTAVATMPADPHFFSVGSQDTTRILLFDSSATRPPVEVVRFDPAPPVGGPEVQTVAFGASGDGRVLVVARRFSQQRTVHYLVRPQTGEVLVLLTDLAPSFSTPVVSPDGTRYAYARLGDANSTGVFIADARAGPDPKRIVASDPQIVGSPPQPVAWSNDGAWLAVSTSDTGGSRIGVVKVQAGETTFDVSGGQFTRGDAHLLGPGHTIDWRGGEQNLLVASSRSAFGGRSFVYTTTIAGGQPREVYVPTGETVISDAEWHPSLDRFFVYEVPLCCGANRPATIWIRKADGTGTRLFEAVIGPPWWSKDGTRLWAQTVGDDSVSGFRDLLSTDVVMFCLRSPTPPCA
jgi:Tol biopolymer transport system component